MIFKDILKEQHLTSRHVITNTGKRVRSIVQSFRASLKRAGIQDFKFHDLRHIFASQVLLKGGSLKDIQELFGHKMDGDDTKVCPSDARA